MKAVLFTDTRDFAAVERDVPMPGPDQVLLNVELCGICGTDLHAPHLTDLFTYPVVLGHEFTASIAEVGPDAPGWSERERVVVNPVGRTCGTCASCLLGLPN